MSSVTSAESESSPRPDKRPASPAQSPQPKRVRPTELSLGNSAWEGDHPHTNPGEQSGIVSGSPRIQLPSIFSTFEDPFRSEHRRASLPTLSSELSSRGRLPSAVAPATRGLAPVAPTSSSLSSYQFPSHSSLDSDDKASLKPKLAADTQVGLSFADHSSLPSTATLSSSGTTTSSSTSPSYPTSSFGSPLTADYSLPRAQLPSLQFSDSEPWGTATSQAASLPGIVRPNSTPGPVPSSNAPLKYDESLRHSSLGSSYTFPPSSQAPMYGNVARISGQAERRASYTPSSTSETAKEEWNFSSSDILLPSASANGPIPSPSRTPPAPPAHSSLVDRPQKKRGKLPKPTTDFLKDWLHRHSDHPYPSEDEKKQLCAATGLSMSQVSNWMINVGYT
jgi:Homeobox KN domain